MHKLAIIDLGSNSVRMIIMRIDHRGAHKMIEQAKVMVRLSQGTGETGELQPEPIERTIETLHLFQHLMRVHDTDRVIPVATAAVRDAANQAAFLAKVEAATNLHFSVLSGDEEATYDYLGVINTLPLKDFLLIDTGGGSTELALVKGGELLKTVSLRLGAVTLTETFFPDYEVKPETLREALSEIRAQLLALPWIDEAEGLPIVGVGGTLRSLAKIDKYRLRLPLDRIHGYTLSNDEVFDMIDEILSLPLKKRRKIKGISSDRAEVIAGGLLPLRALLDVVESPLFMVSGNGLREGLFHEVLQEQFPDDRPLLERSLSNLAKRYEVNETHSSHVHHLSRRLLTGLRQEADFFDNSEELLLAAATLHDTGMFVDYYDHHKHSFYLTLNSDLEGLSHEDLVKVAFMVGRHRPDRKLRESWRQYRHYLDRDSYEKVKRLATLLMMAEKLDRSEDSVVHDIAVKVKKKSVILTLKTDQPVPLEKAAAMNAAAAFKKAFGKRLIIRERS